MDLDSELGEATSHASVCSSWVTVPSTVLCYSLAVLPWWPQEQVRLGNLVLRFCRKPYPVVLALVGSPWNITAGDFSSGINQGWVLHQIQIMMVMYFLRLISLLFSCMKHTSLYLRKGHQALYEERNEEKVWNLGFMGLIFPQARHLRVIKQVVYFSLLTTKEA